MRFLNCQCGCTNLIASKKEGSVEKKNNSQGREQNKGSEMSSFGFFLCQIFICFSH